MNNPSVWRPFASSTDGVPNLTYLSGIEIPVPEDGITVFVVDTGTGPGSGFDYQLSLTSGATIDGYDVVGMFLGGPSRWLRLGGVAGSVGSSFIYREGAAPEGAVFAHWRDAYNAAIASNVNCFIGIDDSIAPCHVPAGTYVMDLITIGAFEISDSGSPTVLNFDDGAHFTGLGRVRQTLTIRATGATSVITIAAGPPETILLDEGCNMTTAPGAAPFVSVLAGGQLLIALRVGCAISSEAPGTRTVNVALGGTNQVVLDSVSNVNPDVFFGAGVVVYSVISPSASFSLVQPGLTTPPTADLASKAELVNYTPAALADWSGISPTSVANALDRIAAKITPIP